MGKIIVSEVGTVERKIEDASLGEVFGSESESEIGSYDCMVDGIEYEKL